MKASKIILVFMVLICRTSLAQNSKEISIQLSYNEIQLEYKQNFMSDKLWAHIYTGISNQDINKSFDDCIMGMGISYDIWTFSKNKILFTSSCGLYIPNNKFYSVKTTVLSLGIRYKRYIGLSYKHLILVNMGYQYGKSEYKESYASTNIQVSSIGIFELSPIYFSLGYGFKF